MASRFENLFGKMLPIWAGGLTLAIAGVLIVRYAIDAGFFATIFTPTVQIITGLLFGLGLIGAAEYAWRHEDKIRDARVAQALSGAGIATLFAAIMVAANVYQLIGPMLAFAALALITAGALGLSLRFGAPSALIGLIGGLAAPALVGAEQPNIPLLSLYLAITVAGLAGVSRARRWPWLALAALIGGMGWGLWLVMAGNALDLLASLSVGGFILALAIALPLAAFDGPRTAVLQSGAAVVGALQLALLVGYGGFSLLHWGLFVLIAAAGQWLAWRERHLAIIPSVSLLLSLALLSIWPDPSAAAFAVVALALLLIHAVPLVLRLWTVSAGLRPALELCLMALAIVPLTKWHFGTVSDALLAAAALLGSAITAWALLRGWPSAERTADQRFASISATCAALLAFALGLLLPLWLLPVAIAAAALGLIVFSRAARDLHIERAACVFLAVAALALIASQRMTLELPRLLAGAELVDLRAFLRWGGVALVGAVIAARAETVRVRQLGQALAALLTYAALAQVLPRSALILVPALAGAATLYAIRKAPIGRVSVAICTFAGISAAWAALPAMLWLNKALLSLSAVPMVMDEALLSGSSTALRLLLPAILFGVPLYLHRAAIQRRFWLPAFTLCAVLAAIAAHIFYRMAFAALVGEDFVTTGIAQRLIWVAVLMATAYGLQRRNHHAAAWPLLIAATAHTLYYSLLLHNPLWAAQAVGGWPIANWLIPLFLLPGFAIKRLSTDFDHRPAWLGRAAQICLMLLVCGFAWATLRQLFHGSLLVAPGVTDAENILRSILLLALALGFLLWGIATKAHDWRIASLVLIIGAALKVFLFDASGLEGLARIGSFVVLGFSLIGIGWLYSRQLAPQREAEERPAPSV